MKHLKILESSTFLSLHLSVVKALNLKAQHLLRRQEFGTTGILIEPASFNHKMKGIGGQST